MKCTKVLILMLSLSFNGLAQKNFFLYIQTESKQPFSVRMDSHIYSSTEMGYVIVPKLFGGDYSITIDFPKNIFSTQQFDIIINQQDLGFVLKNMDSKGWVLQNLQTAELIAAKNNKSDLDKPSINETDDFSKTLSQITNTPLPKENKQMPDTSVELANFVVKNDSIQDKSKFGHTTATSTFGISLVLSSLDTAGRSLIYAVRQSGVTDTVVIFIPVVNTISDSIIAKTETADIRPIQISTDTTNRISIDEKQSEPIVSDALTVKNEKLIPSIKCFKIAEDKDFMQLRKKMAAQDKEDGMIVQAEKAFKSKCFTTTQVRNLAGLFLEDKNRLQFLLSSRSYLSDPENFGSLESLLSEQANISRFKEFNP